MCFLLVTTFKVKKLKKIMRGKSLGESKMHFCIARYCRKTSSLWNYLLL